MSEWVVVLETGVVVLGTGLVVPDPTLSIMHAIQCISNNIYKSKRELSIRYLFSQIVLLW